MSKAKTAEQVNTFGDLKEALEKFQIPGVDMDAIIESRRKDIDALVAANQAAMESMKALSKKQTELMTQAMQGVHDAASVLSENGTGAPDPVKYAEIVRKAYEKTVRDMTEMADMARKAQSDLMSGITQRATQSLKEIQALTQLKK
jgi:phasin family protein